MNFQERVGHWISACFGHSTEDKTIPRSHRFLEEALELAQATGCTQEQANDLVRYVFSRPVGPVKDEIGGTLLTLASLANTVGVDMSYCGELELIKNYARIEKIRAKAASKTPGSALPGGAA